MKIMSHQQAVSWTMWAISLLILVGALPAATASERVVLGEYFTNQY